MSKEDRARIFETLGSSGLLRIPTPDPPLSGWSNELVWAYLKTFGYPVEHHTVWSVLVHPNVEYRILYLALFRCWRGTIYHRQNGTMGMVNCKDLEDVMSWLQNRWSELQETTCYWEARR